MKRRIQENLYRITKYCSSTIFVECSTIEELCECVREYELKGNIVTSVSQIYGNGTMRRIAIKTNSYYKKLK